MTPEIFVSYSREDQEKVFQVVDQLRVKGLKVWIDQQGIQGAKLWSQEIVTAIEESKVLVLFASKQAFASKNVAKELALASESEKHILPVFMEEAPIPSSMKYQLAGIQHLVYGPGQADSTVKSILDALSDLSIGAAPIKTLETGRKEDGNRPVQLQKNNNKGKTIVLTIAFAVIVAMFGFIFLAPKKTTISQADEKLATNILNSIVIVTNYDDSESKAVSDHNRELRETLINKLDDSVIITSLWGLLFRRTQARRNM